MLLQRSPGKHDPKELLISEARYLNCTGREGSLREQWFSTDGFASIFGTLLVVRTGSGVLLACSGQRPGTLQNNLK